MKNIINKLKKNTIFNTLILYSLLFCICFFVIGIIFYLNGKTFLWDVDGIDQHVVNLKTFRSFLIEFFKTGKINAFYWNIGNGMDLYSNYAYYIMGDPFAYLSVLVPGSKVYLLYSILLIVRLYFIGIAFIAYARYKKLNSISTVIGAIMYTFCTYSLLGTFKHPYFCNAMIICPLVILAIERIIIDNKPIFYSIIVALMFIMSFYFAYMLAIIIVIYASILIITTYKKEGIKKIIQKYLQILLYSIIGVLISSVVLIPTAVAFLNTERVTNNVIYPYNITYYRRLISSIGDIKGAGYWLYWGMQSLIFLTLPKFMFRKNKEKSLKILFLILLIPLLFSKIGSLFCGLSYPNNRWSFIFNFIFAFMTTSIVNDDNYNTKDYKNTLIFVGIYLLSFVIFDIEAKRILIFQLITLISLILITKYKKDLTNKFKKINLYKVSFITIFTLGIMLFTYSSFSVTEANRVSSFLNVPDFKGQINNSKKTIPGFNKAINYINKNDSDEYFKVSKYPYNFVNLPMLLDYNSIGAYYSLTPKVYNDMTNDLLNPDHYVSYGNGEFNYRTRIDSLLGTKYLVTTSNDVVPYGYKKIKEINKDTKIYKNKNNVSFASLYTTYITEDKYDKLSPLEKEITLLKTVVLSEDNNKDIKENKDIDYSKYIQEIKYKIEDDNKIIDDKKIEVKDENKSSFKLKIDEVKDSEIYVYIKGIEHKGYNKKEIIKLESKGKSKLKRNKIKNKYKWYTQANDYFLNVTYNDITTSRSIRNNLDDPYYIDIDEFMFNLGYNEKSKDTIEINLSALGHYTYDEIKVFAVKMKDYEDDIDKLNESNFELKEYKNNYLRGYVNPKEDGILQFQTLFNDGFTVYVDNKEVDTFKSNKYFLGINISKGKHKIEIIYNTPYINDGLIASIGSTFLLILLALFRKPSKKENSIFIKFWNWGWGIYHKNEEIWNYLIVGGLTTVVSLGTYYLCVYTFLNPNKPIELQIANIISWVFAVVFAYITNRKYVFKSKEKNIKKEAFSFIGSRVATLLLDMLMMFILVSLLCINDKISKVISQVLIVIANYIISKLIVFKNKSK